MAPIPTKRQSYDSIFLGDTIFLFQTFSLLSWEADFFLKRLILNFDYVWCVFVTIGYECAGTGMLEPLELDLKVVWAI